MAQFKVGQVVQFGIYREYVGIVINLTTNSALIQGVRGDHKGLAYTGVNYDDDSVIIVSVMFEDEV